MSNLTSLRSRIQYGFLFFCIVQFFFVLVLAIFSYHYGEDQALAHAVSSSATVAEYSKSEEIPISIRDSIINLPIGTHELSVEGSPTHAGREIHVAVITTPTGENIWRLLGVVEKQSRTDLIPSYALFASLAFLVLFAFGGWLARTIALRISQPLETLIQRIDDSTKISPFYAEKNYFSNNIPAGEIRHVGESLDSAFGRFNAAMQREKTLSRNVSLELRTPLTVIRTALDTHDQQCNLSSPLDRARRAAEEMDLLTCACIDLARSPEQIAPNELVSIADITKHVIKSNLHLLDNKDAELDLRIDSTNAMTLSPGSLTRLVIGNAIRNAFIHSADGTLAISLSDTSLTIVNSISISNASSVSASMGSQRVPAPGFGVGLSILGQACERLGWRFAMTLDECNHSANTWVYFTKN